MRKASLRVLILFSGLMTPPSFDSNSPIGWTGAATRFFEVLKKGQSRGVEYVVVFEKWAFLQATKQFSSVSDALKNHRIYLVDLVPTGANVLSDRWIRRFMKTKLFGPILKYVQILRSSIVQTLCSSIVVSRIATEEKVDLVLSTSESSWLSLEAYIAAKISRKPWTAIWQSSGQLSKRLSEPTVEFSSHKTRNIMSFASSKANARRNSKNHKLVQAITALTELMLAERTLTLTVSRSIVEQIGTLNPRAKFHLISPGNGIDLSQYQGRSIDRKYDAIFFARLVPQKGLYDLPKIWNLVLRSLPQAKLAVVGIPDDSSYIDHFNGLVQRNHLSENIAFLGEFGGIELIQLIKSSGITLYPSTIDSFALAVLESLACGVPVVAYDIPAIRENYGSCPAVLRCDVRDVKSMARRTISLLKNENLRTKLSEKAEEYSAKYDWSHVAKSEKEAYFRVIEYFNSKKAVPNLSRR